MRLFKQDTKVEALRQAPLFQGMSRHELGQLAQVSEDIEAPAGKVLCKEGDVGQEFFVIVEGELELTRQGESLGTATAGDFFGEIALVEDIPRTATVTAKTPVRFFVLTRQAFGPLLEVNPGVQRKVMQALARRVADLLPETTPT
jgi:CRP/FNR family transcriptional regulator, cyclic AMP receptor protein